MSSLDEFHNKKPVHIWPITLLRIYTGVFFLKYGWGKITNPNFVDGLAGFVSGNLDKAFGFMRPFLESVVLPHKGVFAVMVGWGEFLVGLSLVVGLATRWSSIAGALMMAAF
jgi:thiosulfate dehydrogenase [quinone] large subunit